MGADKAYFHFSDKNGKLRNMILEVSTKNFILMGDFNYGHIDWSTGACESGA